MSIHQHKTVEDTVYFWFGANDTSGSGGDGANPLFHVRLGGAAGGAVPVISNGVPVLLDHANYPAGCYELAVAATGANGFSTGNTYGVFCTLLVDSQNPTGFVGSFTLVPISADVTQLNGSSIQQSGGYIKVSAGTGTGQLSLSSGVIVADMTKIHGTGLTETPGQLAAAFVKLFDVATPLMVASIVPDAAGTASSLHSTTDGLITTVDTIVDAIKLITDVLPDSGALTTIGTDTARLTAVRAAVLTDWINDGRLDLLLDAIITHLTDVKGTGFAKDTDSLVDLAHTGADSDTLGTLSDQLDGLSTASGEGALAGTLTVDDGATGLEGVVVNARRGGVLIASGTTDSSGEITGWVFGTFTYDLALRLPGYEPATDTIAVSADAWAKTISLTANTISAPPNASTTTGVMTVYDEEGSVESGVTVTVQITDGPGTDGIGYDSTEWAETSSALGVIQFAGIIHGAQYKIWRGTLKAKAQTFTAPTSGTSFDLAEVIGRG